MSKEAVVEYEKRKKEILNRNYDLKKGEKGTMVMVDFPINGPDGMGWRCYKFELSKKHS